MFLFIFERSSSVTLTIASLVWKGGISGGCFTENPCVNERNIKEIKSRYSSTGVGILNESANLYSGKWTVKQFKNQEVAELTWSSFICWPKQGYFDLAGQSLCCQRCLRWLEVFKGDKALCYKALANTKQFGEHWCHNQGASHIQVYGKFWNEAWACLLKPTPRTFQCQTIGLFHSAVTSAVTSILRHF